MDDLKRKKKKAVNKKNDLLINLQEKIKKKRNSDGKGKLKTLNGAPKSRKPSMLKDVGRLRIKGSKGIDGMFLKGLRSEYITRASLNEANEARKNEDLNKIIDLGRAFIKCGGQTRDIKSSPVFTRSGIREKSKKVLEISSERCDDFEGCPLSPISFALSCDSTGKFGLEKELEEFSEKYEDVVGDQVLNRLPEHGVLEDALKALRERRILRSEEAEVGGSFNDDGFREEFKENDVQLLNEFQSLTKNFELEVPDAEDFIQDFIFPERVLLSECRNDDTFMENPLDRALIMTDMEMENYNHPSFTPSIEKEDLDMFPSGGKTLENTRNELNIVTPPFRFYRRNMF